MENNEKNDQLIEMNELSGVLKATDSRTAIKWCQDNNLPVMAIGKKKMTYRFLAEAELDKHMIQILKKRYPDKWEDLYQCYKSNDHYKFIVATQGDSKSVVKMDSRVAPKSKFAKDFAKG